MCWKWPPFASRQDWILRAIFWKLLASTSDVTAWISSVMFAFKGSMVRGCFGKLSLSDIHIRNNQAASDRASAVAKVPSKWRSRQKRTEFRPCWLVKCGMSLHPAGNIQLRVPHRPKVIYKGVEDFHIYIYAAVVMVASKKMGPIMRCRDIPHQTPIFSEWRGFFMYRVGIFTCPDTGILRVKVSRQVKPRLVWETSVIQNARIVWNHRQYATLFTWSQQLGALQTHSSSFLTQRKYSSSNFVAVSSLVLELSKKCRVR